MRENGVNNGASNGSGMGSAGYGESGPPQYTRAPAAPEHESFSLRDYFNVVWRRKWIVLLVLLVATGSAFFFSYRQPAQYAASADLIYEQQLNISNPLTGQSYTDAGDRVVQLSSVGSIIASPDMQQRAAAELSAQDVTVSAYKVTSQPLADSTGAVSSTIINVVRITATSGDAQLTAAVANAYATAFVSYRRETVKGQIQRAIDAINTKMATYPGATQQSTDYLLLQQRLADLQLLRSTATGNFRVLVPATVPAAPFSPKPMRSAVLGFGVGLLAAIGLAFVLEQFDTRVRKPEEIAAIIRNPILGRVPRISHKVLAKGAVTSLIDPRGHVAEAFRMVRTNLEFLSVDQPVRSVLVTSCVQGEGKSSAVANLAVTLAMTGKKVVIVDADLRRPRQHAYFGLRNDKGVSTVASGQHALLDALRPVELAPAQEGTAIPDFTEWAKSPDAGPFLFVMPSGPIPPNPGEIVASERLSSIIDQLSLEADIVVVDTPAMLPVGDTSAIAPKVDGLIFLVDMHVIKKPQLQAVAEQLRRLPVRMLGTIVRGAEVGGRYSSSYRYDYSYSESGGKRRGRTSGAQDSDDRAGSAAHIVVPVAAMSGAGPAKSAGSPEPESGLESS